MSTTTLTTITGTVIPCAPTRQPRYADDCPKVGHRGHDDATVITIRDQDGRSHAVLYVGLDAIGICDPDHGVRGGDRLRVEGISVPLPKLSPAWFTFFECKKLADVQAIAVELGLGEDDTVIVSRYTR